MRYCDEIQRVNSIRFSSGLYMTIENRNCHRNTAGKSDNENDHFNSMLHFLQGTRSIIIDKY
jgi:hypothetical protein